MLHACSLKLFFVIIAFCTSQRSISHASTRSKYSRMQHEREHGPEMEEVSLKHRLDICKMRFGPIPPGPSGRVDRLSRVRNYSQFRVNASKTICIAAQIRMRAKETRKRACGERSKMRTQKHGRSKKSERAKSHKTDLYPPRPMSPFRFVLPSPCRPLPPFFL